MIIKTEIGYIDISKLKLQKIGGVGKDLRKIKALGVEYVDLAGQLEGQCSFFYYGY